MFSYTEGNVENGCVKAILQHTDTASNSSTFHGHVSVFDIRHIIIIIIIMIIIISSSSSMWFCTGVKLGR